MRLVDMKVEVCEGCDAPCISKCNFLKSSTREDILKIARGEYSKILEECLNCYACEEFCPHDNHPFYRIVELQETYGIKKLDDEAVKALIKRYEPEGDFKPKSVGGKYVHICLFPEMKEKVRSKLFENYEVIRGRHVFCNLVYLHYGIVSIIKDRAKRTIENLAKLQAEEIVLYHDECYAFYNSFARAYGIDVPFKYLHLFEFLLRELRRRKVRKLNIKAAYQRPCSNRLCGETDKILDEIFEMIGVERVNRKYDRENALCCGAAFVLSGNREVAENFKEEHIKDIVETDATHVVFNCPMCYRTLGDAVKKEGFEPVMVSDLCEMALD